MICNRSEDIDLLVPYIGKPVYVKGYCWGKSFDGWTVIYDAGASWLHSKSFMFDYRGQSYPVLGFLPSKYTMRGTSSYNNAIYREEQ